ncbi:hypothetical protein [Microbulbifer discodermiae]|uniref:hypothetical protein n=1 Tax=Microbulbifer sp. 2201CG32-9 TaxID=3232309 RepID=UPI00345BBE91
MEKLPAEEILDLQEMSRLTRAAVERQARGEEEIPVGLLLNREQILGAKDLRYEDVEVPEWGGSVRVCTLSGSGRDQFEAYCVAAGRNGAGGLDNVRATVVSLVVVDEKGERLFSKRDVEALGRKSASALDRVFEVAQRLNRLSDKDIEELEENLPKAPGEDSSSD